MSLVLVQGVTGGNCDKTKHLTVQQYDLLFVAISVDRLCTNGQWLTTNGVDGQVLAYHSYYDGSPDTAPRGGNIKVYCLEMLESGEITLVQNISSSLVTNMDMYIAHVRPSSRCQNITAYTESVSDDTPVWTDELSGLLMGEAIFCTQFSGGTNLSPNSGHKAEAEVDSTPDATHKGGTATITVMGYGLPQGSTNSGDLFAELLEVTGAGTFKYFGPNPMAMRLTLTGDPSSLTPPAPLDDTAEVEMNDSVVIDVLDNDLSGTYDIDSSTVAVESGPSHGNAVANGDGTITYTPTTDYYGEDTFTYKVQDTQGNESPIATVTVTVNGVPLANDDTAETDQHVAVIIQPCDNDVAYGSTIDEATAQIESQPDHGWLYAYISGSTWYVKYTPESGFSGEDAFTYKVQDAAGVWSNVATVTVTVNYVPEPDPPPAPPSMQDMYVFL